MRLVLIFCLLLFSISTHANEKVNIPILCYHNLNATKAGWMNMKPEKFAAEMQWLLDNGYHFIPLHVAVEYLQGKPVNLPSKPIVLTADDGWQSAYTHMYPITKKLNIPLTLFIYPETVSVGKNAVTWDELKEMQQSGMVFIEGHTYSHPNFKQEKKHMSAVAYEKFVRHELAGSKEILEKKMGIKVTALAWPFGIYNSDLEQQAAAAGYVMAFTIDGLPANRNKKPMAQPRYMIIDSESMGTFEGLMKGASRG